MGEQMKDGQEMEQEWVTYTTPYRMPSPTSSKVRPTQLLSNYTPRRSNLSHPQMEFLDINLTEDSGLLLHAIHSSFFLKKTRLFSGFKNPYKKIREKEGSIHEYFCRTEN